MSDEQYIYASSRIVALEAGLLSESQMERMISAKSADEVFVVLNDTFLAPYIAGGVRQDLPRMLRKSVSATKKLIASIAPVPDVFDVLWLRYDFYNVKTIIKGTKAGLTDDEIIEQCFYAGKYDVERIIDAVRKDTLAYIHTGLAQAYKVAMDAEQVYEIDFAMNIGYFNTVQMMAQESGILFLKAYVRLIIDFFNLSSQLRLHMVDAPIEYADVFVMGGSYQIGDLSNKEDILAQYAKYGNHVNFWKRSVEVFEKTGDYAVLVKATDDYIVRFVKEYGLNIMSPVPLFGYFLAHRNNTQIIKTIMVAKESGMEEVDLRRILRRLYI